MKDPQKNIDAINHMLAYLLKKNEKNSFMMSQISALKWSLPILEKHVAQEKDILKSQLSEVYKKEMAQ